MRNGGNKSGEEEEGGSLRPDLVSCEDRASEDRTHLRGVLKSAVRRGGICSDRRSKEKSVRPAAKLPVWGKLANFHQWRGGTTKRKALLTCLKDYLSKTERGEKEGGGKGWGEMLTPRAR